MRRVGPAVAATNKRRGGLEGIRRGANKRNDYYQDIINLKGFATYCAWFIISSLPFAIILFGGDMKTGSEGEVGKSDCC